MERYKVLETQIFSSGEFSILPIRMVDRYRIMKWRNEQMFHLRQEKLLTEEDQDHYFENIVKNLFEKENPEQLLFSYLEGKECIGYGGLVHINWRDKNAEISFLLSGEIPEKEVTFHWRRYLSLLEKIAFQELNLHKIYTYAFDVRPNLYNILESAAFKEEARLKDQHFDGEKYRDVIIHCKINGDEDN